MLDYQRIVDDVRSSLAAASVETADFFRMAAADYLLACDEVNQRLRQCGELLRKGLRSEAIQVAELEPNLLEVVALLDFPEYEQWRVVAGSYGVRISSPLQLDVAAELNEAYAIEQPLAALMHQHRLLAMARSPLPQRINTLRRLAKADPHSPIWFEDLRVFEQERLRQIQRETADAATATDLERLGALYQELTGSQWLELPPVALVDWVAKARHRQLYKQAIRGLAQTADRLNDAFASFEVALGRQHRDHWNMLTQVAPLSESDELYQRAAAALDWLAEQDQIEAREAEHQACTATLERALDRETPVAQLEKLYHATVRHGHELSEPLEIRYRRQVSSLQLGTTRRRNLIVVSTAAGIILLASLAGFGIRRSLLQTEIATRAAVLNKLLEEEKLVEAQQYLQRLEETDPGVAASSEVSELAVRLESALRKEQERAESFATAVEKFQAGPLDEFDRSALTQAEKLAKTNAEKAQLMEFTNRLAAHHREQQKKRDQDFSREFDVVKRDVERLGNDRPASVESLQAELSRLRSECRALEQRSQQVSAVVLAQMKPVWARLNVLDGRAEQMQEEEQLLNQIRSGGQRGHLAALARYVEKRPNDPRSLDFQLVAKEAPLWEGLVEWNELVQLFASGENAQTNSAVVASHLSRLRAALEQHGDYPSAAEFRRRLPQWESIAARLAEGKPIVDKLERLFNDSLLKAWVVETKDGRRYYTLKEPVIKPDGFNNIRYVSGFDLVEKSVTVAPGNLASSGPAPQTPVAEKIRGLLDQLTDDNWETCFQEIVTALNESRSMEPLLKLTLLKQTLEIGCKGSSILDTVFESHLAEIQSAQEALLANWLDPNDDDLNKARAEAVEALKVFTDLAKVKSAIEEHLESGRKAVGKQYVWSGYLMRNSDGDWNCGGVGDDNSGELFVVYRVPDQDKVLIERVGQLAAGLAQIDSQSSVLLEGRPVFVERSIAETVKTAQVR